MTKSQWRIRKEATVRSLFRVGESGFAHDFNDSEQKESFQTIESAMRDRLKSIGPQMPKAWIKAIGNATSNGDDDEYRDGAFPPSRAILDNDRRLAKRGLSVIRFSSGAVMTQNSRGRCEDAPCCGCCT